MKRRALLLVSSAWLAGFATGAASQVHPGTPRLIAFLNPGTEAGFRGFFDVFRAALKGHGYVEGRDVVIDARWAEDRTGRLDKLAAEIVARNPELIVTAGSAGVAALKRVTSSIPVVFATAFNPVEQGFISSLQRPGGNVTGVVVHADLTPKVVEVAREAFPMAQRLALLVHQPDPAHKRILEYFEASAARLKFRPIVVRISEIEGLDRAFEELAEHKAELVLLPQLTFFVSTREQIARKAIKARLPLLSVSSLVPESGGLLSYGTESAENYRRAAAMVDKILRGARPSDLPVEQPERFVLVVNRKTASEIGVKLQPVTLLRADRIID